MWSSKLGEQGSCVDGSCPAPPDVMDEPYEYTEEDMDPLLPWDNCVYLDDHYETFDINGTCC